MFKEKKIASYTAPGTRIQLLEGFTDSCETKIYQIRNNRKVIYTTKWENIARQQLYAKIKDHLFQLSLL